MFEEQAAEKSELVGMGDNIVKFSRKETNELVCYMSCQDENEFVFFNKPVSTDVIITIAEMLQKKKLRKALKKSNFGKAQKIADKMFK
jgi:hypothetical protein